MSTSLHSIKIKDIQKETEDCVSIAFDIPDNLKSTFAYQPGQYLTLESQIFGESVRRAYSLCSDPSENEWRVAIKKVPGGKFSTFANEVLTKGYEISIMPPQGRFVADINSSNTKNYLGIAAGSGITPVISIVKSILKNEPESHVTLIYGNKSRLQTIFFEELEGLKNQYISRLSLFYIFSREKIDAPILNGRIGKDKLNELGKRLIDLKNINDVFICGPAQMTEELKTALPDYGVPKENIHFELFANPGQETEVQKRFVTPPEIAEKQATIKLTLDGKTIEFPLAFGGENILDAALQEGADLPYACKGGVCCTCRAKLVKGEVEMEVNYSLEPEEVDAGFILTCQSHPRTDVIEVDFDQQ